MAETAESPSGATGRLIGWSKAQQAVDTFTRSLTSLDKSIAKATGEIASGAHRAETGPRGFSSAWNGSWTKQTTAPNGGGSTFGGQPSQTSDTIAPTTAQGTRKASGFMAAFAGAGLAGGVKGLSEFGSAKLPGLVQGQTNAYQTAQSAPGRSWSDLYKSTVQGNITAHGAGDATGAARSFSRTGGFGATQDKGLLNSITSVGLVNPDISNSQAVGAASTAWGAQSYNKMRAFGISTIGKGGRLKAPRELAQEILRKIPGSDKIKSKANITAGLDSPTGGINQTIMSMVNNGLISPELEDVVREEIRGILLTRVSGKSFKQYDALMTSAGKGDKSARQELKKAGISGSNTQDLRGAENSKDSRDAEFITSFSKGVETGAEMLVQFNDALKAILKTTGTGGALYGGGGLAGTVSSTVGGAVGGATAVGSGLLGAALMARAGTKVAGRGVGRMRGGAGAPRTPAPGSRAATRAVEQAAARGASGGIKGAVSKAATVAGKGALGIAKKVPLLGLGISAAQSYGEVDERMNREAYFEAQGSSTPGLQAFSAGTLNNFTFGAYDALSGRSGGYDADIEYGTGGDPTDDKQGSKGEKQSGARVVRLKRPCAGKINSGFSMARKSPVTGRVKPHKGIDIGAASGTPILAAAEGTVTESGSGDGRGNYLTVKHPGSLSTNYYHQSKKVAQKGASVAQGQLIGYVGSTGDSTGPHLHFEVRVNGTAVDPMPYLDGVATATAATPQGSGQEAGGDPAAAKEDLSKAAGAALGSVASSGTNPSQNELDILGGILGGSSGGAPGIMATPGAKKEAATTDAAGASGETSGAPGDIATPATGEKGKYGAEVERWRGTVLEALGKVGAPASDADATLRRMKQESGGNPRAINNWDINAKNGVPSKGLMQVIQPTFESNAAPGYSKDIWDPMSNILASMRYAKGRYGSLQKAYNKKGGYAKGAWELTEDDNVNVHKGEMIIPAQQSETIRQALMKEVNPGSFGDTKNKGGGTQVTIEAGAIVVKVTGSMTESAARRAGTSMADSLASRLRAIQEV